MIKSCQDEFTYVKKQRDDPQYRRKYLCLLGLNQAFYFVVGPILVLIIYLIIIKKDAKHNEYYDECCLSVIIWIFLFIRTFVQEYIKGKVLSNYYEFPLAQRTKILPFVRKNVKCRKLFYYTFWTTAAVVIGITPCIIRATDIFVEKTNDTCFYNNGHLAVIVVNILILLYLAHTFAHHCAILSKRWHTALVYVQPAINYWKHTSNNVNSKMEHNIEVWHNYMLNISYVYCIFIMNFYHLYKIQ